MIASLVEKIKASKALKAGFIALSLAVVAVSALGSVTVRTATPAGYATNAFQSVVALVSVPEANAQAVYTPLTGITMPQADVDALGEQSINATLSILTVLMQFGKYFVILAAVYGIVRFVKGFIGHR
jgi:hypothetical protein